MTPVNVFYNQSSGVCLANVGIYDCKLDCTLKGMKHHLCTKGSTYAIIRTDEKDE